MRIDLGKYQDLIFKAVGLADKAVPNEMAIEKEHFAVGYIYNAIEQVDHLAPVVGQFMDLTAVDKLQYSAVRAAVVWALAELNARKAKAAQ